MTVTYPVHLLLSTSKISRQSDITGLLDSTPAVVSVLRNQNGLNVLTITADALFNRQS